jgi:fused signal recognition particle receptor
MDSKPTNGDDEKMPKRSFLDRFKRSQVRSEESSQESPETQIPVAKPNFAQRMRSALSKTGEGIGSIFLGSKVIDEELFEELETSLLIADVGIETTAKIIADLTAQSDRQSLKDGAALKAA